MSAGKIKNKNSKLERQCAVCGEQITILLRPDNTYRGGHFFGKIPIHSRKEWKRTLKAGTHKSKIGNTIVNVLNKDPKPYKRVEYWECPKCYWG